MKRKNLKRLRIDLDLKQKDFAEKLKVSNSYYCDIENGKRDPSFGFMVDFEKFCDKEGIIIEDIWRLFKKFN